MTTPEPDCTVSDDAYGLFIYASYRLPLDKLEHFKTHKDPRVAEQAHKAYAARTGNKVLATALAVQGGTGK